MSVLSRDKIEEYLTKSDLKKRLVITPLLGFDREKNECSIDVRLGSEFIVFKKIEFSCLDIGKENNYEDIIIKSQERVIKKPGDNFILHPRNYIIGSTFEYIKLPPQLMCYVTGKSTLGRTGLIIATATKVDPGFRGCITLEIINGGEVPIALYPGMLIAQLVFHETLGESTYAGIYDCPIGPLFPKLNSISEDLKKYFLRPR